MTGEASKGECKVLSEMKIYILIATETSQQVRVLVTTLHPPQLKYIFELERIFLKKSSKLLFSPEKGKSLVIPSKVRDP